MMSPLHTSWSVVPWTRYDTEPPNRAPIGTAEHNGHEVDVYEQMDPEWHRAHVRHGVEIHDPARDETYRATLDGRGQIDHLEVEIRGHVDENAKRRLPLDTIRRVTHEHLQAMAAAGDDSLVITLPGGLVDPTKRGEVPSAAEIADLMTNHGLDRHALAARYDRPVRTVDRWITNARRDLPDRMPRAKSGPSDLRREIAARKNKEKKK